MSKRKHAKQSSDNADCDGDEKKSKAAKIEKPAPIMLWMGSSIGGVAISAVERQPGRFKWPNSFRVYRRQGGTRFPLMKSGDEADHLHVSAFEVSDADSVAFARIATRETIINVFDAVQGHPPGSKNSSSSTNLASTIVDYLVYGIPSLVILLRYDARDAREFEQTKEGQLVVHHVWSSASEMAVNERIAYEAGDITRIWGRQPVINGKRPMPNILHWSDSMTPLGNVDYLLRCSDHPDKRDTFMFRVVLWDCQDDHFVEAI